MAPGPPSHTLLYWMSTYLTADTHFGDHRTINIHRRPFSSAGDMDAHLIERWNATVRLEDKVWQLGDFARRPTDVPALLERLNGVQHLVRGKRSGRHGGRVRMGERARLCGT